MSISFWGTGASPFATWNGIAPLPSNCLPDPDGTGCTGKGHFYLTLNTGNPFIGGDTGGWNDNPSLFLSLSGPEFTVTYSTLPGAVPQTLTPEPAMFALVGSALIGLGLAARRRRGRKAISEADARKHRASASLVSAPPA